MRYSFIYFFALFTCNITIWAQIPDELFKTGNLNLQQGKYKQAIDYYNQCFQILGADSTKIQEYRNLYINRGYAHYLLGNHGRAMFSFATVEKYLPNALTKYLLARYYYHQQLYSSVIDLVEPLYQQNPDSTHYLTLLNNAKRALKAQPVPASNPINGLYEMARSTYDAGKIVETKNLLKKLLELQPNHKEALRLLELIDNQEKQAKVWVIIISVGTYQSKEVDYLTQLTAQSALIEKGIKNGYQNNDFFNIRSLSNDKATLYNIYEELGKLKKSIKTNDMVFIYFMGHGAYDDKHHYHFLPYDYNPLDNEQKVVIPEDTVKNILASYRVKHSVLIMDNCRTLGMSSIPHQFVQERHNAIPNTAIIYSTNDGKKAIYETAYGGSLFASVVLDGLNNDPVPDTHRFLDSNNDQIITIQEFFKYLSEGIKYKQKEQQLQIPVLIMTNVNADFPFLIKNK